MTTTIKIDLFNKDSIRQAKKELKTYKKDLQNKCKAFVEELANIGLNVAMMTLAHDGVGDAPRGASFAIKVNQKGQLTQGILEVTGEGILFWEFGAGFYFNAGGDNPYSGKFGMGAGTYPGQTHVPEPGFWYYTDEQNDAVRSYGTEATMPMYKATMEMIQRVNGLAKQVFGV